MHSIHGRAPAIATGLATARPDLSVWVIGGDGDMLSIGGNHLIHALRRNVNLTILLLNNQIYGLTKGQYSPTSERGKVTKSTPMGSVDQPFNPLSVAIGAEATFVARAIDTDKKELTEVLRAAAAHRGASFVEVFQNCNIYNDGAFDFVREQKENRIYLKAGEPIVFGDRGVRQAADGSAEVVDASAGGLLVHDPSHVEPSVAFALSRLTFETVGATPFGVFRSVERPGVRRGRRGADPDGARAAAATATSRRCSTPATPGRSADARRSARRRSLTAARYALGRSSARRPRRSTRASACGRRRAATRHEAPRSRRSRCGRARGRCRGSVRSRAGRPRRRSSGRRRGGAPTAPTRRRGRAACWWCVRAWPRRPPVIRGFGAPHDSRVRELSPSRRAGVVPRTGYSGRCTSIETMAPGRMKRSSI